jgi:hypothetical protein
VSTGTGRYFCLPTLLRFGDATSHGQNTPSFSSSWWGGHSPRCDPHVAGVQRAGKGVPLRPLPVYDGHVVGFRGGATEAWMTTKWPLKVRCVVLWCSF